MRYRPARIASGGGSTPAKLEPDAIGVAQDTVIGLANVGPALSVGLILAALAAAAYAGVIAIALCGAVMLVIANAHRRLNLWNATCGASFMMTLVRVIMRPPYFQTTREARNGAVMNAPARQHDVTTCLVCAMTSPSPDSPCLPGWDRRVSPPEAGCPGCGRLPGVCARRFPCQARRSSFGWQLARLRIRRAWRRLRPRPGPSCCDAPGRCSR